MRVWVATTVFRNDPRWRPDGAPDVGTFVDGVGATVEVAQAFARDCSDAPLRHWLRHATGRRLTAAHRGTDGIHFHQVESWDVATEVDADGGVNRDGMAANG